MIKKDMDFKWGANMKSQKWDVQCSNNEIKIIRIQKANLNTLGVEKTIYETKNLIFSLGYNQFSRLFQYKLTLNIDKLQQKSVVGNIINIIFNETFPIKTVLNILYEDHNIRLLSFEENGVEDFVLVGRWKTVIGSDEDGE